MLPRIKSDLGAYSLATKAHIVMPASNSQKDPSNMLAVKIRVSCVNKAGNPKHNIVNT